MLLCPLILSHLLCLWSPFCTLHDPPSSSSPGVCPLVGEVGPEVCALTPLMDLWLMFLWPEPALDIEGSLPLTLWLLPPCLWWVWALVGRTEPPDLFLHCDPDLCGGRWDWSTPLGEKLLRIAALGMFPLGCALCIAFTHRVSLVWPWLALILAPPHPWVCRHTTLGSLRCCFHQVTSIDPWSQGPGLHSSWS